MSFIIGLATVGLLAAAVYLFEDNFRSANADNAAHRNFRAHFL